MTAPDQNVAGAGTEVGRPDQDGRDLGSGRDEQRCSDEPTEAPATPPVTGPDLRATLIEAAAAVARDEWPADEYRVPEMCTEDRELMRDFSRWSSFGERHELLNAQRQRRMGRKVLDAVLPLLAEAVAAQWAEVYPPEVFTPIAAEDVPDYHRAFTDAGLSIDRWSAHVMQYGYRGAAALLRSLTEGTGL